MTSPAIADHRQFGAPTSFPIDRLQACLISGHSRPTAETRQTTSPIPPQATMRSARTLRESARSSIGTTARRSLARPLPRPNVVAVPSQGQQRPSERYTFVRYAANASNPIEKDAIQDENPSMAGPSNLPSSTDLLEVYRGMVAQGRLSWDEEQVRVVMKVCPPYPITLKTAAEAT